MNWRIVLATSLICATGVPALARQMPIEGKYGNDAGCRYARTGESEGADVFFLLTPESVTTAASYCEVKTVAKTKAGAPLSVIFSCEAEGEDPQDLTAKVTAVGSDAYEIAFDDGTKWGPLMRCK